MPDWCGRAVRCGAGRSDAARDQDRGAGDGGRHRKRLRGARKSANWPLVVDPVMMGKHGMALMDAEARSAMLRLPLRRAALVTPNLDEAAEMAGISVHDAGELCRKRRVGLQVGGWGSAGDRRASFWERQRQRRCLGYFLGQVQFTEFLMQRVQSRYTHGARVRLFGGDYGWSGAGIIDG